MPTYQALQQAQEAGLDLVEVNPTVQPPACKLVDFGKLQYEKEKQERKQKAKQKRIEVKGIRLSATIAENDINIRIKQAEKFLSKGDKVEVLLQLRGRQRAHPQIATEVMNKFINSFAPDTIILENPIKQQGGRFTCLIAQKK
jgi:translation initiation factor IF-3